MKTTIKWLMAFLTATIAPQLQAQLAPTGEHYAGRPSDTGFGGTNVSATGSFSAAVPLRLPHARGDLPIPLQIAHGARGVGAAGVGWDLPLSYIQRNRSFAHRRPTSMPATLPAPRERVHLLLLGQNVELVRDGSVWVARSGTRELVARESAGTWLVYDGGGRTYTFVQPPDFASTGLWLLKSVSAAGGAKVELSYLVSTWPLDGGIGTAIDLIRITYNTHPIAGCPKNEIALSYGHGSTAPVSLSLLGDKVLVRKNTLSMVDVMSRETCSTPLQRLRRYEMQYLPDADTLLPRLHGVRMFGQQGTAEENVALPIANYAYGSATQNGSLRYEQTQTIPLPAGVATNQVSGTALDSSVNAPGSDDRYAMWQSLTDVTGDGRPDLVFKRNNKLWVAHNQPAPSAKTTIGAGAQTVVQLADATFASGGFSTHTTAERRFAYGPAKRNTTNVWRQAIDVNGDGRIDIIDAAEESDRWVVYLNTPGGPSGVKWERRSLSVKNLRAALTSRGHAIAGDRVPLSRRATGTNLKTWDCWRWNGTKWQWYAAGFANHRCEGVAQQIVERGPERTHVEWELSDLNGDGYPDFVFNSSPVDFQVTEPPSVPTPVLGAVFPADFGIGGPLWHPFAPRRTNEVRASLNVRGVRFDVNQDPFALSFNMFAPSSEQGLSEWRCSGSNPNDPVCDDSKQSESVGIADVNGDGLLDRIVGRRAYLGAFHGTAVTFSKIYITLPGPAATLLNDQKQQCVVGGTLKPTSDQLQGLRDLTGDGVPDYYDRGSVWIGTGTGFRPPIPITLLGGHFRFSHQTESCDGDTSHTDGGLFDIDADGRPDVIGLVGNTFVVSQLAGGHGPNNPDAGRLTVVDNGFGARTRINYTSAKQFTANPVPFPEIVVSAVSTAGMQDLGGSLAGSRYAYSNAGLVFDSAADRFVFPGYRRRVEVALFDGPKVDVGAPAPPRIMGAATITDTWPLTTFSTALTRAERWLRVQRLGKVRDVLTLRGVTDPDPWSLLGVDANDPRVIGVSHHDWAAKLFQLPLTPTSNVVECIEMMLPLDFAQSVANNFGSNGVDTCRSHGFAFNVSIGAWYGASAPPSNNNVQTQWRAREVDDFGRFIVAEHMGDVFRSDDDVCVEQKFAAPAGDFPRVLTAMASRRVSDCGNRITYASESWRYDALAPGLVTDGRPTSHIVERRATDNGALLSTVRTFDVTYDAAGTPVSVSTQRGGSTRTVTVGHDPFGLVATQSKVVATGLPSTVSSIDFDPISLEALRATDANSMQTGAEFDGFGRLLRSTLAAPGGSLGVMSTAAYQGFSGSDSQGRRLVVTTFSDPVAPANVATATGRVGTVFLDELGRARRTELALGSDYSNETIVAAATTFDASGRAVFVADPYPKSQAAATAYGTSYHFKNTGDLDCIIRGRGPQPLNKVTDLATERLPTCFERFFVGHVETRESRGPASLQAGSPETGIVSRLVSSAIGRPIEQSTMNGALRLDHATFAHDRLGQQRSMTRFLTPAGTDPVHWTWRVDSIGQLLQLDEPDTATRHYSYSDWGEPVLTQWMDGATDRRLVRSYDALGRLTRTEERNNGVVDAETINAYAYDTAVTVSPHVTPTFVLGRLAAARSASGQVAYSYDGFGRVNAQTFSLAQGAPHIERSEYHANGRLASLEFNLPDQSFAPERVKYGYDSAGQVREIIHDDTTGARELYRAETIDALGRVRKAVYGTNTVYSADYADEGRRLIKEAGVQSSAGSRRIIFLGFDALERELSRREIKDGAPTGAKTNVAYNALGQLATTVETDGPTTLSHWNFTYDALGNILRLEDVVAAADTAVSYSATDRDRICRIGYGNGGLGGSACNVTHDVLGNVVNQPTRNGSRQLSYFLSGQVRSITEQGTQARFGYDPFGHVQTLDVQGGSTLDKRRDRRYGTLLEGRETTSSTASASLMVRNIPGPGGIVASRRGPGMNWVFAFGELRGNRFFTDQNGTFVQDVGYQPYGDAASSGAPAGAASFTSHQWNGGDALGAFGVSHLGARLYDPVIGRFLSRDPMLIPRTAARTNPYAFALNDPLNAADPSGLDCIGKECNPDAPILPIGPLIDALGSLFGGGSDAPAAPGVSKPAMDPRQAKALYDEARYQAEQAKTCAMNPNSHFCDTRPPGGSQALGKILSPFTSAVGVPSYYVKTDVSRAGMQQAQTGVEYFAARDAYNTQRANIALSRVNEETARFLSSAMALSGAMVNLGASGSTAGANAGTGSRFAPNSRPNFIGASGGYNYRYGYAQGAAASEAGKELVLGKFPGNVNYVTRTPGTATVDVPSGWTPTYNAGYVRGFLDGGGKIRFTSQDFSGTFKIEAKQVLTIPGGQ